MRTGSSGFFVCSPLARSRHSRSAPDAAPSAFSEAAFASGLELTGGFEAQPRTATSPTRSTEICWLDMQPSIHAHFGSTKRGSAYLAHLRRHFPQAAPRCREARLIVRVERLEVPRH